MCYLQIVINRSAETLPPIIVQVRKKGTVIHLEGWADRLSKDKRFGN